MAALYHPDMAHVQAPMQQEEPGDEDSVAQRARQAAVTASALPTGEATCAAQHTQLLVWDAPGVGVLAPQLQVSF